MFVGGALTLKGNIAHFDFTAYAVLCSCSSSKKSKPDLSWKKKDF